MSESGVKVCGVMTLPRSENSWARTQIQKAFAVAGVPLQVNFGVFYGHCMQRLFEDAISRGVEIVVTVDGDSVIDGEQVKRILSLVALTPGIDAATAMQPKRGDSVLLGYMNDGKPIEIANEPVKAQLGHFGLTAIDLRKLASVSKPWFWSKPAEDGTWGDGRIDDDIWFWRQWESAGHSLYIDPQTCIGHLEEMVAIVDPETFEVRHCYPDHWQVQ